MISFTSIQQLLDRVDQHDVDLICTYRNLHTPAADHPYSLGGYIDVLTQATDTPTLLLPSLEVLATANPSPLADGTRHVMVITDHLAGDHQLVSRAAHFVTDDGELILSHIEDQRAFDKYIGAIEKIPDLDSEIARQTIRQQLLAEPVDYIESCRRVLEERGVGFTIRPLVSFGNKLDDYRRLILEHHVDLLVMPTKDDDQLAMHGVAYPLVVELRQIPILLL